MGDSLDRDDIISGLRDLVGELHTAGEVAGIRLVGGAALVIRYFDRRATGDLDSLHIHPGSDDAVLAAAERVADRRGWSAGWFNFAVENADSVPTFGRRPVEWETIYDRDSVVVQVASKEALLAMKLRANRPGATWTTSANYSPCAASPRWRRSRSTTRTSIPVTASPTALSAWSSESSTADCRQWFPRPDQSTSDVTAGDDVLSEGFHPG